MEKIEPSEQKSDLSLVGFENVFVQIEQDANNEQVTNNANIHEHIHELHAESHELVTMAEASRRLKMPYPTLRRQVLTGKIPSAPGPDGKPMVKIMAIEHSPKVREQRSNKTEQKPLSSNIDHIQRLLEQIEAERTYAKALNEKLEAAYHRNGFLEGQVIQQHQQIELLTDSQHKSSWWSRFCSWLIGTKSSTGA